MIDEFIVGAVTAKAISGKYKPNLSNKPKVYVALSILILLGFMCITMGIYLLTHGNVITGLVLFVSAYADVFLIGISPWTQNPNNYRFEIKEGEPIENLNIFYKEKLVIVDFVVNENGKIEFADDNNKHKCIRWGDESRMSQFTRYRILNAFAKHMADINLLSDDVRVTFE